MLPCPSVCLILLAPCATPPLTPVLLLLLAPCSSLTSLPTACCRARGWRGCGTSCWRRRWGAAEESNLWAGCGVQRHSVLSSSSADPATDPSAHALRTRLHSYQPNSTQRCMTRAVPAAHHSPTTHLSPSTPPPTLPPALCCSDSTGSGSSGSASPTPSAPQVRRAAEAAEIAASPELSSSLATQFGGLPAQCSPRCAPRVVPDRLWNPVPTGFNPHPTPHTCHPTPPVRLPCAVGRAVECDIPESLINELGAQQYQVRLAWLEQGPFKGTQAPAGMIWAPCCIPSWRRSVSFAHSFPRVFALHRWSSRGCCPAGAWTTTPCSSWPRPSW